MEKGWKKDGKEKWERMEWERMEWKREVGNRSKQMENRNGEIWKDEKRNGETWKQGRAYNWVRKFDGFFSDKWGIRISSKK